MTGREREVVRAVIRSLRKNEHLDMNALRMSYYAVPHEYDDAPPKRKAAMLLEALIKE